MCLLAVGVVEVVVFVVIFGVPVSFVSNHVSISSIEIHVLLEDILI